jgi:hypothetical protein
MSMPRRRLWICGLMPTPPKTASARRAGVGAVGAHAGQHLGGEFARRHQHQHARRGVGDLLQRTGGCLGQALQERQDEGGGLAGAGLGQGFEVAPAKDVGDGLRLHRRGRGVALLANGAQELGRQAEFGELHGDTSEADPRPGAGQSGRKLPWG